MPLRRTRYGMAPSRYRTSSRRAVALSALPNGLTIANLFCGIFAIVLAARHNFSQAGMYILIGGIADALDGRVARATNSGTRFGAELDSLVDVISFGFAPALIMFFAVLNQESWTWLLVFFYTMCACIRLARFNVEQAGRAKRYFRGLPSPAAGLTLATYYWFSQTDLYQKTMIANVPWNVALLGLMAILSWLMISNVSYPAVPTVGYKSVREILGSIVVVATILGLIYLPKEFFFPACLAYVLYGFLKTVTLGLLGKRDTALLREVAVAPDIGGDSDSEIEDDLLEGTEPVIAVASSPRLTVSADSPMPAGPQRRRRRRRPPRSGGERGERPERSERMDRPERGERLDQTERSDHSEETDGTERFERSERSERLDRTDRGEHSERPERPDRPDRSERPHRRERFNRQDRSRRSRHDRRDRPEQRPENPENTGGEPPSTPPAPPSPPSSSPPTE